MPSPAHALKHGIALLPEDRRNQGLIRNFSVRENATLPSLARFRRWSWFPSPSAKQERDATVTLLKQLDVHAAPDKPVGLLSGGNQQKIVLTKWLLSNIDIFIFDEPTQGIDVEVKEDIFALIRSLAVDNKAVIFISSELAELERVASRVLVLREGRLVAELFGREISENRVLEACYETA